MSLALNLVEIIASCYLLAVIGALVYVDLRAFMAKRGPIRLFSGHPRRERRVRLTGSSLSRHQ
jgi:hypothetical protein